MTYAANEIVNAEAAIVTAGDVVILKPKRKRRIVPLPSSSLIFTDEESFRYARRRWEHGVQLDAAIPPSRRLVLLHIASFGGWDSLIFPAESTVAKRLAVSVDTVARSIDDGKAYGWLMRIGRRGYGGTVAYRLGWNLDRINRIEETAFADNEARRNARNGL